MPLASCLPTLSAPSQTSPQLLFVCFVAHCGVLSKQESKSKNQKARIEKQKPKATKNSLRFLTCYDESWVHDPGDSASLVAERERYCNVVRKDLSTARARRAHQRAT